MAFFWKYDFPGDGGIPEQQAPAIDIIGGIASTLSFVGSTFWVLSQATSGRALANTSQRLILGIAISDMLWSFVSSCQIWLGEAGAWTFLESVQEQRYIWVYTLANFFMDMSVVWTLGLITHAVIRIVARPSQKEEWKYEVAYALVALVFPVPIAILGSMESPKSQNIVRWMYLFIYPLFTIYVSIVAVFLRVKMKRNAVLNQGIVVRVMGYVAITIICWVPVAIAYTIQMARPDSVSPFYNVADFLNQLWGFLGVLVYGMNQGCFDRSGSAGFVKQNAAKRKLGAISSIQHELVSPHLNEISTDRKPQTFGEGFPAAPPNTTQKNFLLSELSNLEVFESIGSGATGNVYKGVWYGTEVAIKQIRMLTVMDDEDPLVKAEIKQMEDDIEHEAQLLAKLRHPRIVLFMAAGLLNDEVTIITEFCARGSLFDVYTAKPHDWVWAKKIQVAIDTAEGLIYLHMASPPIIHGDIKSMNVLLTNDLRAKLTDFGTSKFIDIKQTCGRRRQSYISSGRGERHNDKVNESSSKTCARESRHSLSKIISRILRSERLSSYGKSAKEDAGECKSKVTLSPGGIDEGMPTSIYLAEALPEGKNDLELEVQALRDDVYSSYDGFKDKLPRGTTRWGSPELLCNEPLSTKADVYSFGMTLYEIAASAMPFDDIRFEFQVKDSVMSGLRPSLHNSDAPQAFTDLIELCWQAKPENRPEMGQILEKLRNIQSQLLGDDGAKPGLFPEFFQRTNDKDPELLSESVSVVLSDYSSVEATGQLASTDERIRL